jgi:hypothetical protein
MVNAAILAGMPVDRRPVGETCAAIIAAIRDSGVPDVKPRQPAAGVATLPTRYLMRAIGVRLLRQVRP